MFEFHVMQQRVMRIDGGANPGMTQQGGGSTLAQTVFKTHMADGDDDPVETLISRLVFVEVRTTTGGRGKAGSRPACKPCADHHAWGGVMVVVVQVPCTDDLIESPLELRARHGPYLHR